MSTHPPPRLVIFGASRGTGAHLVTQALAADLDVNAVVRRPEDITRRDPRLIVYQGDLLKPETLTKPLSDADAVVFLAGPSKGGPSTLYSTGGANVIAAMRAAGVSRIVAVTAALVDRPNDTLPQRLVRRVVRGLFKEVQADRLVFESMLHDSGLDWTVIRPPRLTDKPPRGTHRTAMDTGVRGGLSLARADLAQAILTTLTAPQHTIGRTIDIAY